MRIEPHVLSVSGLEVSVVRKAIKHLHLAVHPPDGRVRVAAPLAVDDEAVRLAVLARLGWIRRQQKSFSAQARDGLREYVSGESHHFFGRRYRLSVVESAGRAGAVIRGRSRLDLIVARGASREQRERVLLEWYRTQLRAAAGPLIVRWSEQLGVEVKTWGIKRMKTLWGACKAETGRVWLNLDLARKPPECLEYVVVHELAHLLVRHHDARFEALLDRHLPNWRATREALNASPLASGKWEG